MQPVQLAGSYRCWFVKKYCWLVCVREKYCSGWKFTIVYDKPRPNEQAKDVVTTVGPLNPVESDVLHFAYVTLECYFFPTYSCPK